MSIADVVKITEESSLYEAALLMKEKHVGTVIVTAKGKFEDKPIGIITERDMLQQLLGTNTDPKSIQLRYIFGHA